jgi:hypothetical protein
MKLLTAVVETPFHGAAIDPVVGLSTNLNGAQNKPFGGFPLVNTYRINGGHCCYGTERGLILRLILATQINYPTSRKY